MGRDLSVLFVAAGACAVVLVLGLHLTHLGSSPPGLWADEAAIGYNAWAIGHFGVDEHGVRWPVFFESFGDYKSPIYVYLLAPLTRVFALTPTLVRVPAGLCGVGACLVLGLMTARLTGRRWIGLFLFLMAAVTPWVVLPGRLGFEVVVLLLLTSVVVLGAVHLIDKPSRGRALAVGFALAALPYSYATGRLLAVLLTAVLCVVLGPLARHRVALLWVLPPVVGSYAFLALWAGAHRGALTARFSYVSVFADSPSLPTAMSRSAQNYLHYFDPRFLLLKGDANLRHNTGSAGMLLWGMLPALVVGAWWCLRQWRNPRAQFLVLGLLSAPIPAAVTQQGTPHALRSAGMLPFLFGIAAMGCRSILQRPRSTRRVVVTAAVLLTAVQATAWTTDLYRSYPDRAVASFGNGQPEAIAYAGQLSRDQLFLSYGLGDFSYLYVLFSLHPEPGVTLQDLAIRFGPSTEIETLARPGDVLVLTADEEPPAGSRKLYARHATVVWAVGPVPGLHNDRLYATRRTFEPPNHVTAPILSKTPSSRPSRRAGALADLGR